MPRANNILEDFPNRQLRKKLRIPLPQITTPFSENVTGLFQIHFLSKKTYEHPVEFEVIVESSMI